jgi:hypothetical protein
MTHPYQVCLITVLGNHTYIWGWVGQTIPANKKTHNFFKCCKCLCVINALMHHQYRLSNPKRLYGVQDYTYGYKGQLMLRASKMLGRCQGSLAPLPPKGQFRPPKSFFYFSTHISWIIIIMHQEHIVVGIYGDPHALLL